MMKIGIHHHFEMRVGLGKTWSNMVCRSWLRIKKFSSIVLSVISILQFFLSLQVVIYLRKTVIYVDDPIQVCFAKSRYLGRKTEVPKDLHAILYICN